MLAAKPLKIAASLAAAISLYAWTGFYLLPKLGQDKLPALLTEATGFPVQLNSLSFNPFLLEFGVTDFAITSPDGKPLLAFASLKVNLNGVSSIVKGAAAFDQISLDKPLLNIEHFQNGQFNFSPLLNQPSASASPASSAEPSPPLHWLISQLTISEGHLSWLESRPHGQETEILLPVNFSISDLNSQSGDNSAFDLSFTPSSGGHCHWQGQLNLIPLGSAGQLDLEDIALTKLWQLFLQEFAPLRVNDGRLSISTRYQAHQTDQQWAVQLTDGSLAIKQLQLNDANTAESLLNLPNLNLAGITIDSQQHSVRIGNLSSADAKLNAWQTADGLWNFQQLLPASPPASAPAPASSPADDPAQPATAKPATTKPTEWQLQLDQLALNHYQLQLKQASAPLVNVTELNLNLKQFNNHSPEPIPLELSAELNHAGQLSTVGQITLNPLTLNVDTSIADLKLKQFQGELDKLINLELVDGELNSTGKLAFSLNDTAQLTFSGDANIAALITRDKLKNKDFLKWADLKFEQIQFNLAEQRLAMAKLVFDQPYVRFNIKKDHSTNISDLLISTPTPAPTQAKSTRSNQPGEKTSSPSIQIGKIVLQDGRSDFADYSLLLPFVTEIKSLNGQVEAFSSSQNQPAKLSLQGKVFDLALVDIKGNYQVNNGDSDINLNFTHMPLPLITPYMAEFSGYTIEKGQMTLDLQYSIHKGQLQAQNQLFIDQLTLGQAVENPHARNLPLHLAIALLQDSNGKINLNFPVSGSLNDPQFSFETIITDALGNLLNKIATSPFKALGSLLDQDKDYSAIDFPAGSSELSAAQLSKLEQLAQALTAKPGLMLEIKGRSYQALDWPVLRFDSVIEILKKMKSGELRDQGQKIRSEYIELSDSEYKRLLAKFFKEVFPTEIEYSFLGSPRVKSQPEADFYALARQKLEAAMPPDPQRLNGLAIARANAIAKFLIEQAAIHRDRIYILASEISQAEATVAPSQLSLGVAP